MKPESCRSMQPYGDKVNFNLRNINGEKYNIFEILDVFAFTEIFNHLAGIPIVFPARGL